METFLSVKNLTVSFGTQIIIDHLNFELLQKQVLVVVGPNGAGKTVLLRALLGFIPYEGEIKWARGVKIGYVPQKFPVSSDFPLSVKDFLLLKTKSEVEIVEVLKSVELVKNNPRETLNRTVGLLSGGELQRLLIAWALLGHPDVLLFDEPTRGIDIGGEATIYHLLHTLRSERALAMIIISHDLGFVYRHATNVLCLNKQRICYGPPERAIDKNVLERLYGKEVGLFSHEPH